MKRVLLVIAIAFTFTWTMMAQSQAGTASGQTTTAKESHSMGKKHSTVTGCISKDKDASGDYTLTNGRYKKGVDVTGTDDLGAHAGHKVQLTGMWTTPGKTFEETKIKHISDTCTVATSASAKSKKSKTSESSATPKG